MPKKQRILFFDIVRILCIVFIVYGHFFSTYMIWFNIIFYPETWSYLELYPLALSSLAVYGLIFVSGAVIEYNYPKIRDFSEYKKFIVNRFIRLYPAYWISLLFGIIIAQRFLKLNILELLLQFSGLFLFTQNGSMGPDIINVMGWFIGTIFILYLIFPLLSKMMNKSPHLSILLLFAITLISRYILVHYNLIPGYAPWRWFPLCNLFEFGLGIYIIQKNFYPKNRLNHQYIGEISDFTFYVFLYHLIIIQYIVPIIRIRFNLDHLELFTYSAVIVEILLVSAIAMIIDKYIQRVIKNRIF